MAHRLEGVFAELGLSQYLNLFVEQGFDTWETILDIQESDLDALGVKLGHRRKLQRRIANARGIALGTTIVSPFKTQSDDGKQDGPRATPPRTENHHEVNGVTKRKYRRHPKPDENAPGRPPSAYVLFSNKMRDDLKNQNLTFTEIAKLVGENWQSLPAAEKEAYESQASNAKEKYHRDLVEYKKTPDYKRYAQYLREFKEKQAKQSQVSEMGKRMKEPARLRHGSSSSSAPGTQSSGSISGSGSGSGSERLQGSEPPPTRRERMSSNASVTDSPTAHTPLSLHHLSDEPGPSPRSAHFDTRDSNLRSDRRYFWRENGKNGDTKALPPLSDMLDDRKLGLSSAPADTSPYTSGFVAANHRRVLPDRPAVLPPARPPVLRHEPSSNGSVGSLSSAASYGRPSTDGPMPLHNLLASHGGAGAGTLEKGPPGVLAASGAPMESPKAPFGHIHGPRGYGFQSAPSAFSNMRVEQSGDGDVVMTSDDAVENGGQRNSKDGFDGMSALLRAGEIVGRGHRI